MSSEPFLKSTLWLEEEIEVRHEAAFVLAEELAVEGGVGVGVDGVGVEVVGGVVGADGEADAVFRVDFEVFRDAGVALRWKNETKEFGGTFSERKRKCQKAHVDGSGTDTARSLSGKRWIGLWAERARAR